ncbi:unnamed protein product [Prunus armeniaca]|uniref:Uncharacterized protein n=1 Tax=Prunus armeniaca TaxID=36596 RepID=A0A6J5X5F5_PRUAR|nr:unnamed protein product [Prunus armeniaca]CAB4277280.1 unnamed protein product [Prunus armeniaca]CAB4307647.1 unnamed protein product [Prunus armeniaca]CAB4307685.1 unnamed protein product [Prunus armeniaca]
MMHLIVKTSCSCQSGLETDVVTSATGVEVLLALLSGQLIRRLMQLFGRVERIGQNNLRYLYKGRSPVAHAPGKLCKKAAA